VRHSDRPRLTPSIAFVILSVAGLPTVLAGEGGDEPEVPRREDFLVIPLKVHVLAAADLPEVDCRLTDADVIRIVGKVNRIWHQAGLHWGLKAVVREPAARRNKFRLARDLGGEPGLHAYRELIPDGGRAGSGAHVYFVHDLPVNGVWFDAGFAVVRETARLREVEGGIDEPIPRVTAHELGHMLGLSHRQAETNLLASGTTGTLLIREECETARVAAAQVEGVRTVSALREAAHRAEDEGVPERALKFWTWLAEIPGDDEEARRQVDRLKDPSKLPTSPKP
jgi:hypothetical protein